MTKRGAASRRIVGAMLGLWMVTIGLAVAYAIKQPCLPPAQLEPGEAYRRNCYSDVAALYERRTAPFTTTEHNTPLSEKPLVYRDVKLEYPALTGLFVQGANAFVPAGEQRTFFAVNALGLAAAGAAGAVALGSVVARRGRLAMYALGPAMLSYAFHNWDLLAVGLLAVGLVAFARGRDGTAGLLLGLGAAAKLFPGVAVPALVLARIAGKRWPAAGRLTVAAIAGLAIPNLVVLAFAGAEAWWYPYSVQARRLPAFETAWYMIVRHLDPVATARSLYGWAGPEYARLSQILSVALFVVTASVLLVAELRRPRFRPFVAAFGCLVLFLVTAKVYSVQFSIWLLPLFVLVRVPVHSYVAFAATDMFVLGSVWALGVAVADGTPTGGFFAVLEIAVWLRYAALLYVLWWTRRSEEIVSAA